MLCRCLGRQQQSEHVDVELLMEGLLSDGLKRGEFINPGVVHQDIQTSVVLNRGVDDACSLDRLRDVAGYRNSLAASRCDCRHDSLSARLAGSVVDYHRSTFGC